MCEPGQPVWVGIYSAPEEIGDIYWGEERVLVLAGKGDEEGKPRFYRLSLEGTWI